MKIHNLKVNGIKAPLGYHFDYLTFSWEFEATNYNGDLIFQLEVALDKDFTTIVWQGETDNRFNTLTTTTDFLEPRTKYFWRIRTGEIFADSVFETGKMSESWRADWISYQEETIGAVVFSKNLNLTKEISQARLYALGLGLYEVEIDGQKVGNEYLTPGYHSYDLIQQYQTYNVTECLKTNSQIRFLVGNGWYRGRFVFEGGFEDIYGDKQKLIAELHITYSDGTSDLIMTDNQWRVSTSVVQDNSIYDGEIIDFSKDITSLTTIVDSSGKDLLKARIDLPVGIVESIPPKVFRDTEDNLILDFGQEITGWIEGVLPAGKDKVYFQFGEILQEGVFYTENLRTAKQEFILLNNEQERYVHPHFTFYGFRYVKVEGLTESEASGFTAKVLHSLMDETFTFNSSNAKLNQLLSNIRWSQKDNFLSIPTDCPQRDERMGWTGDITVFSNTASYNMETRAFLGHFLKMIELEQQELNGAVPFFAPYPKVGSRGATNPFLHTAGSAVWSDAGTVLPITLYRHFHDKGLLEASLSVMTEWVNFVYREDEARGSKRLWDFGFQLGDWLALDMGIPGTVFGATDSVLIATIYYYLSATYTAQALAILDKKEADFYFKLAGEVRTAILNTYFIEDELNLNPVTLQSEVEMQRQQMGKAFGGIDIKTYINTQTGLSMLLRYGLYPTEEARLKLVNELKKKMAEHKGFLTTGFAGTPELPHALLENGLKKEAFELLFKEEAPSWLFEVNMGATTTWERWDSLLPDGRISGIDMNSMNHYAYGAVEDFIIEKLIGINLPDVMDTTATYRIRPNYTEHLEWVSGSLNTANGLITVRWGRDNKRSQVDLTVEIPTRTSVEVILQNGDTHILTTGVHFFKDTML